jgi:hypothetical protein
VKSSNIYLHRGRRKITHTFLVNYLVRPLNKIAGKNNITAIRKINTVIVRRKINRLDLGLFTRNVNPKNLISIFSSRLKLDVLDVTGGLFEELDVSVERCIVCVFCDPILSPQKAG